MVRPVSSSAERAASRSWVAYVVVIAPDPCSSFASCIVAVHDSSVSSCLSNSGGFPQPAGKKESPSRQAKRTVQLANGRMPAGQALSVPSSQWASGRQEVAVGEPILAPHDLAAYDGDRTGEDRPAVHEGVELSVLPAWIDGRG